MINQEKVLRMTKMASYEEHGGRKDRAVVGYFRSDYIGKQTIISLIVITAAFLAGLGAYLVFHFSEVMGNIYSMDLVGTAKKILTLYLMAAVLYVAVTYVIYTIRYAKANGKKVITGAEVFAIQAVEQFVLYTGIRPSDELFRQAAQYARG